VNENSVTAKIIKFMCSEPDCHARKRHGGRFGSGEPDIDGCVFGRAFKCEVKVTGGELTKLQATMLDRWRDAGADTTVAVYDRDAKQLRVVHLHDSERWIDLAGPVSKIDGGWKYDLTPTGIMNWVHSIPDCQGRQGGE